MPTIKTTDNVNLYYQESGTGTPAIFVHEFAGDVRSWEPQIRHFSKTYRCIAFNARGYPPSDVPSDSTVYSQDHARDDILAVLDGLGLERAHIVGLSMGGFATLHFGLAYPDRAISLIVGGCGYGAGPEVREQFFNETTAAADRIESETMEVFAETYATGPARVQLQNKDPRGWEEFKYQLQEHSSKGSANTMRGVQRLRPSLYDLEDKMRALTVPVLIMNGDEDDPCLDAGLYMKRCIRSSALVLLPVTGHACNLEEPALFNQFASDFFHRVEAGRWAMRDPRSISEGILSASESK